MEIRILKSKDLGLFDEFLSNCKEIQGSEKEAWQWYRNMLEEDRKGVILNALILDNKIITLFCSFAVDVVYNYKSKHFPVWVAGLIRSINISLDIPNVKIDSLAAPVALIYERYGYKSFYVVRAIPKYITYRNIDSYIKRVQNKNFPTDRYNPYLDRFIDSPETYKDFDIITHIIPKSVPAGRKIAIFRYDLKYEFCQS